MTAPDIEALCARLRDHAERFPATAQDDGIVEAAATLAELQDEIDRLERMDRRRGVELLEARRERDALQARVRELEADVKRGWNRETRYTAERDALRAENEGLRKQYYDLILQVGNKHPGESRHDTAKRYIVERESRAAYAAMAAGEKP